MPTRKPMHAKPKRSAGVSRATARRRRPHGFTVAPIAGSHRDVDGPANVWAELAGGERLVMRIVDDGRAMTVSLGGEGSLKLVALTHGYFEVSKLRKGE